MNIPDVVGATAIPRIARVVCLTATCSVGKVASLAIHAAFASSAASRLDATSNRANFAGSSAIAWIGVRIEASCSIRGLGEGWVACEAALARGAGSDRVCRSRTLDASLCTVVGIRSCRDTLGAIVILPRWAIHIADASGACSSSSGACRWTDIALGTTVVDVRSQRRARPIGYDVAWVTG